VQLEGFGQMKNPMTLSGSETRNVPICSMGSTLKLRHNRFRPHQKNLLFIHIFSLDALVEITKYGVLRSYCCQLWKDWMIILMN
jgi:hypothetical protein